MLTHSSFTLQDMMNGLPIGPLLNFARDHQQEYQV